MEATLLTPEQAAEFLQTTVKGVHRACKQRRLAYVAIDGRGTRRFTMEHLEAFIAAQTVEATAMVDTKASVSVSSQWKGGGKRTKKSSGVKGKGPLTEEIRSLCRS